MGPVIAAVQVILSSPKNASEGARAAAATITESYIAQACLHSGVPQVIAFLVEKVTLKMISLFLLLLSAISPSPSTALVHPDGIGKLPALGWNSWNAYNCDINEAKVLSAAQKIVDLKLKVRKHSARLSFLSAHNNRIPDTNTST
jgi:hypothetical protein